jgi:hypothetical protein
VVLGIAVLLAILFVVYKTLLLTFKEKKESHPVGYEILNNLN